MFKFLTIFVVFSAITAAAYAGGLEIPPSDRLGDFNGFYVGGNFGVLQGTADNQITVSLNAGGVPLTLRQSQNAYDSIFKIVGGIQLGWGHEFGLFYLGFDAVGTYQDFNVTNRYEVNLGAAAVGTSNTNVLTVSKLKSSYGIDFHPGIILSPAVLLYGRVGFRGSFFKVVSDTDAAVEVGGGENINLNNTVSDTVYGLMLSLGVETKVSQHVSLGFEYQYTYYPYLRGGVVLIPGDAINAIENFVDNNITTSGVIFNINYYVNDIVKRKSLWAHYGRGSFSGLYLGIHGGVRKATLQFSLRHESVTLPGVGNLNFKAQDAQSVSAGGFGGLQLGYGHVFHWFYLGVDALGTFQQIHVKGANLNLGTTTLAPAFTLTTQTAAILDGTYGIDIRPGVVVSPAVMLYGRVGVERTRLRMQTFTDIQVSGVGTGEFFLQDPEELTGLRIGVGVETKLGRNVSMNLEYLYTTYDRFTLSGAISSPFAFSVATNYTVNTEALFVGFNYFFD